jgi:hypothetical protein
LQRAREAKQAVLEARLERQQKEETFMAEMWMKGSGMDASTEKR